MLYPITHPAEQGWGTTAEREGTDDLREGLAEDVGLAGGMIRQEEREWHVQRKARDRKETVP